MSQSQINSGIESLLELIEDTVNELNEEGAGAFKQGDYNRARSFLRDAERVSDFRYKVKALQKEWQDLFYRPRNLAQAEKAENGSAKEFKGTRTPEDVFRRPILESLVELKGSASWEKIQQRIEIRLKKSFNGYDLEALSASPKVLRWYNTARWCLNTLTMEGLVKNDAAEGVWVITEKGQNTFKSLMRPDPAPREILEKEDSNHSPQDSPEPEGATVKRFA